MHELDRVQTAKDTNLNNNENDIDGNGFVEDNGESALLRVDYM